MAAKLMRHWSQMQKVSSFLCMRANVVSTGGKVARARALPQTPFASLYSSNFPRQTDKVSVKEQVVRIRPEHSELENLINSSASVEDLLQLEELFAMNGNYAAMTITRLSLLVAEKKLDPSSILKDPHFLQLLRILNKQLSLVSNASLVRAWRSLGFLGLDPGQHEMQSIKQELCWRLRRLSYRQLTALAEHMVTGPVKGHQDELLSNLLRQLELRWTEIEDPRTLGILMSKVGSLSPALMERLEDKGLELVEQFSSEDIRKVAVALAFQKRRSVPLLRAISYHVVQKHMTLSTSVLLDMAFAYGKLNFPQNQMFQKIAADICPRVPQLVPEDVVRCVKSFAYVKTSNLALFESFAQYTVDNASKFTPENLSNIVLAFARLNFHPSCREAFYSVVHKGLEGHLDSLDPYLLVDLVWSLCVLQEAKTVYLHKILMPGFHTHFLGNLPSKAGNYWLKVIQINTAGKLECEDYAGPFLPGEALGSKTRQADGKQTPLQGGLREALAKVAREPAALRFQVDTVWGWQLDAEMLVNCENHPLAVAEFVAPHLARSEGSKPLPTGARRFAFLRWEFPNFICQSKDLLGRFAMARRHIQLAGFLVVDVPYYEWLELKTEWQKAAYLRDKMNKAVAEEMAK